MKIPGFSFWMGSSMIRFRCIWIQIILSCSFCLLVMVALTGWTKTLAFGQQRDQTDQTTALAKSKRNSVHLYFSDRQMRFLSAEKRELVCASDDVALGRCILEALIQGPQKGLIKTLPPHTELRAFYLTGDGTAYADFNDALSRNHPGGVRSELFTIFAIVNSLTLNLSNINRVQILIDGRQSETLSGHVSIADPIKANILLIR